MNPFKWIDKNVRVTSSMIAVKVRGKMFKPSASNRRRCLMSMFAVLVVLITTTVWFLPFTPARAAPATLIVNTTADPMPSNGLCSTTCSLRYAVNSANTLSGSF